MKPPFQLLSCFAPLMAVVLQTTDAHPQAPVAAAFASALQQKLDSCVTAFDVPGISVALLLPGDQYWNGVSGLADIYTEVPVDTSHLFQLASMTKLYTAATVFQLIDEGLLDLNDPIGDHLPSMPNIAPTIPLRYLLNHRSGLADYLSDPDASMHWFTTPDSIFLPEDIITSFGAPPLFDPNEAFSYSNTNYMLLGMIIEHVTGNTAAAEFRARFLDPMDLDHTFLRPQEEVQGQLIPGWTSFTMLGVYDTDATPVLGDCFSSMGFTAGALVAPPWDVARFVRQLFAEPLISASSFSQLLTFSNVSFSDGCNGYGLGVMRYPLAGRTFYGHGGDISGFTQLAVHQIEDSVSLVVSINRNNAPRVPIANELLNVVYEQFTVGVIEQIQPPQFNVYPVPANQALFISSTNERSLGAIELLDAIGRVVTTHTATSSLEVLPIGDLSAGTYHLRVITDGHVLMKRVIVER